MINIKRSVDFNKEVTWLANSLDEDSRRNTMLYAGNSVNGAIEAAVTAGLSRDEAKRVATAEIERCLNEVEDTITV